MKTPEQLIAEWKSRRPIPDLSEADFEKMLAGELRKFQHEAYVAGMSEAASIALRVAIQKSQETIGVPTAGEYQIGARDVANEILKSRDARKP